MATYALLWNPVRFPWGDLDDELTQVRETGAADQRWSASGNRSIRPGDRVFLFKVGDLPRGIVGSGYATSIPFDAPHWDQERAAAGELERYIDLRFDTLHQLPLLLPDQLPVVPGQPFSWTIRRSGTPIPDSVADALELLWAHVTESIPGFPDEHASDQSFREGATRAVFVDRVERNAAARHACLAHYGTGCIACGLGFGEFYGAIAEDFIQVHHLRPLADFHGEHEIDPVRDLRPVCPNCHAVVHLRQPPFTIEQVKNMIRRTRPGA